jgi:hypothetical protein
MVSDILDFSDAVYFAQQTAVAIIADQRRGLRFIDIQARFDSALAIIAALKKVTATATANILCFGGIKFPMI